MGTIKKVVLENFQSHSRTVVEPAANGYLSVITGPSDSGKTAIVRALKWLFFNAPTGVDFIRAGATYAKVIVEFETGDIVTRWRSAGGINRYLLNGATYEGFGNGVPLEVSQVSGLRELTIGDIELNLNISEQLQGPFLGKSISSGARAKVLGKLAGTEEIDCAAKELATDLYRRNQDEKRLAGEVEQLEERIQAFSWLPGMASKIEQLEQLVAKVKDAQVLRGKIAQMKEQLAGVDARITAARAVLYRWRNLKRAVQIAEEAAESQSVKESLTKLADRYWTHTKSLLDSEKVIARYAGLPQAEERLQASRNAAEEARQLRNLRTSYLAGTEMIQKSRDVISGLEGIEQAGELLQSLDARKQLKERLEGLSAKWQVQNSAVVGTQQLIKKLASVKEAETTWQAGIWAKSILEKLIVLRDKHTSLNDMIQKSREQAVLWENRVAELEGAYHDLLQDAGICPLCGQEIKSKVKEAV